jgi:hypothetical protein
VANACGDYWGVPGCHQAMGHLSSETHEPLYFLFLFTLGPRFPQGGDSRAGTHTLICFASLCLCSWALGTGDPHSAGSCDSHFSIPDLGQALPVSTRLRCSPAFSTGLAEQGGSSPQSHCCSAFLKLAGWVWHPQPQMRPLGR